jgi:hypothetical protein
MFLATDTLEVQCIFPKLAAVLPGDKNVKSVSPTHSTSRKHIVRQRLQFGTEVMVARQHEDQVDIAWIRFTGDETPIYDDGNDQASRTDLGEVLLQFLVKARAAIRGVKRSEAFAQFLQGAIMDARRQEAILVERGDRHVGIPVVRMVQQLSRTYAAIFTAGASNLPSLGLAKPFLIYRPHRINRDRALSP